MGNFCTSDDRELIEFAKFYKLNRDYIITDTDLTHKLENRNRNFLNSLLNINRDVVIDKMSNFIKNKFLIFFRKIQGEKKRIAK